MKKAMRIVMVLLVMGFIFSLTAEAFARDRYGRGGRGGRSFDRGPNYSDVLRGGAQQAIAIGMDVAVDAAVSAIAGGGCGSGYIGGGGYDPYAQGYARAAAGVAWQEERRALQAYNDHLRAVRSMGAAQAYRDAGRYRR